MNRNQRRRLPKFSEYFHRRPNAIAIISGSGRYPDISGRVRFFQTSHGVVVSAEITGLPRENGNCGDPIFAFHIHDGGECTGNARDPFANSGMHYNPYNCTHPYHAGDMPPLFSADGFAYMAFLTDRFTVKEIIGRTVMIHADRDDFTNQPSGNAGEKIACGKIIG